MLYGGMGEMSIYANRRSRLMTEIGPRAVAVFHSPAEARRNGDVQHPFRQSSDLLYLTGFAEPKATLVLRPGATDHQVVLFVRPRDPEQETWNGRRAGIQGATERYGADAAYPVQELATRLPELIANSDDIYYNLGVDHDFDQVITRAIDRLRRSERRGKTAPHRVIDLLATVHEHRLVKGSEEVELLRTACSISAQAHVQAMKAARPGVTEHEIAALVDYHFTGHGCSGPGYPSIVAGGDNATILHYTENDRSLQAGSLLLIDAGGEYGNYTADITRTFPVDGSFTPAQRRVYDIVLAAQKAAIQACRPGVTVDELHELTVKHLTTGMIELGLLQGTVADRIADKSYTQYYMHRTSHWLGMDVHDVGAYRQAGASRALQPGMVLTIEPGLYIPASAAAAPEEFRGIGIRIEDDLLVTEQGSENLTADAPKEPDEVEAACRR